MGNRFAWFGVGAAALVVGSGFRMMAGPLDFDFKDPKGVSGLTVTIDSPLEPVSGHANGISGNIQFDPANPAAAKGKIVVAAASLRVGSQAMTDAMHGDWCLDVAKFPIIEFEIVKISQVKPTGKNSWSAKVDGKFTLHGVTKPLTVTATATHEVGAIKDRGGMPGKQGDLLVIRSTFPINRLDYGVAPDLSTRTIGNTSQISLSFVGVHPE